MEQINNALIKELIEIIKNRISQIKDDIQKSSNLLETDEIDKIFIMLDTNPYEIIAEDVELQIGLLLKEINNQQTLSELISDIEILKIVANAKAKGMNIEFNKEELDKLNNVISVLKQADGTRKQKNKEKQKLILENQTMVFTFSNLYDKLIEGTNSRKHLANEEIELILSLIKDKSLKSQVEVLENIKKLQDIIHSNIVKKLQNELFDEEEDVVNKEAISEELLISIFSQYGLNFSIISPEYKELIKTRCDVTKILEILSIIATNKEFNFIKMYGQGNQKSSKQKKREFRQLYFILKYTNKDILEYLLNEALNRNIRLEEIFKIDGVFKKVGIRSGEYTHGGTDSSDTITGCFEYYIANSKFLDEVSKQYSVKLNNDNINFYQDALDFAPDIFKLPPDVLKENVKIFEQYGLSLVEKIEDTYKLKAPTTLLTRKCAENADLLIETGCYGYILNYPSLLKEELNIKKCIYQKRKGNLEFTTSGKLKYIRMMPVPIDLETVIDRQHTIDFCAEIPQIYIEAAENAAKYDGEYKNDEYIARLESENSVENLEGLAYNIDGVIVSSLKVKRIWNSLCKVVDEEEVDKDKLLLYALSYGSYFSEEQFEILRQYSKQMVGGQK